MLQQAVAKKLYTNCRVGESKRVCFRLRNYLCPITPKKNNTVDIYSYLNITAKSTAFYVLLIRNKRFTKTVSRFLYDCILASK